MPRGEIDADEGQLRVPPSEAEQIEASAATDLEHPARAQHTNLALDDQRLCPVPARVEAAVRVERHVHGATHRVRDEIQGRALREVGDDHVDTAPLREEPRKIEVRIEVLQPLVIVGLQRSIDVSSDIAYSRSPAASRASSLVQKT